MLSSADIPRIKHHSTCRECTLLQAPHALPKDSTWPPLPLPKLLTLSFFLHLFWALEISFAFSFPSYLLDQVLANVWLWDLCVVVDSLAGETGQVSLSVVTTVCHNTNLPISSMSQILQERNLGDVYCFVKFSDQQVWKRCGWQNTDVHPHKLLVWSQEMT